MRVFCRWMIRGLILVVGPRFRLTIHHQTHTTEAKAFNAALADFKAKGAEVFGISRDEDHRAFIEKYGFQLNLLSDVDGAVRKLYNVPASLFGALDGRVTYVIGKDGKCELS